MPFEALSNDIKFGTDWDAKAERYPPSLPEPLIVAVLDKAEELDGRTTAVLVHGFRYLHPDSKAVIEVPERFLTDFASIPQAARVAFEAFGRHAKAAVLHDWLYAVGEPDRKWFADQIFYDAMGELGVDGWRRKVMYEAVHVFGGDAYARAESDWNKSWADWRTGELLPSAPTKREAWFQKHWKTPPRSDYGPW